MPDTTKPRSALGQALVLHQEAVEHCESLYLQHAGEVTDEVEDAEARRDLAGRDALEALARYRRWLDGRDLAVADERERLSRFEADTARRRQWADGQIVALTEHMAPGRSRLDAGTLVVKIQRTTAVDAVADLDATTLPPSWQRLVPERVVPATVALDKTAAKADLQHGFREGVPPRDGWYDVEGMGLVWMEEVLVDPAWTWAISRNPEDELPRTLSALNLSIDPEPGRDVLRWCPSHPGVTLARRAHVKVG